MDVRKNGALKGSDGPSVQGGRRQGGSGKGKAGLAYVAKRRGRACSGKKGGLRRVLIYLLKGTGGREEEKVWGRGDGRRGQDNSKRMRQQEELPESRWRRTWGD